MQTMPCLLLSTFCLGSERVPMCTMSRRRWLMRQANQRYLLFHPRRQDIALSAQSRGRSQTYELCEQRAPHPGFYSSIVPPPWAGPGFLYSGSGFFTSSFTSSLTSFTCSVAASVVVVGGGVGASASRSALIRSNALNTFECR